jgi:hypothetical protein
VQGKVTNCTDGHEVFLSIIFWRAVGMMDVLGLDHPFGARRMRSVLAGAKALLTAATTLPINNTFNMGI